MLIGGITLVVVLVNVFGIGCPIRTLLRVPCPTCGMTRSFFCLLSFRFGESWRYHPMTVPLLLAAFAGMHRNIIPIKKIYLDVFVIFVAVLLFITYIFRLFANTIP